MAAIAEADSEAARRCGGASLAVTSDTRDGQRVYAEVGEFHPFVVDGPIFQRPLMVKAVRLREWGATSSVTSCMLMDYVPAGRGLLVLPILMPTVPVPMGSPTHHA